MPRPFGVTTARLSAVVSAALLAALVTPVGAQEQDTACTEQLSLNAARDGFVDLRVSAPCQPYRRVDIAYGPLVLTEETSHQGHVDLRLPRFADEPQAVAQIGSTVLNAALPKVSDPSPVFVALIWSGQADLGLQSVTSEPTQRLRLGFPFGDQARRAEILMLEAGAPAPELVDILVRGQPCAPEPVYAAILTSASDDRLPLTIPALVCGESDERIRLAVPG